MQPDERLTELEIKVAYLENAHDELSAVVRELFEKVAALTAELRRVRDLAGSSTEKAPSLEDEKPPHY